MSDMMLDFENDLLAFFRDPKLSKGVRQLALYCSVPYFLTADLVLRICDGMEFADDVDGAAAEILQAPFVRHIMGDYYRMDRVVRDVLRHWLRSDYDASTEERVARLLRQYVEEKRAKPGDIFWHEYLEAQMVAAQAIINPRRIAEQIAYGLQKHDHHSEAEERDRVTRWSLLAQEAETDLRRIGVGRLVDYARYRADQLRKRDVIYVPEDLREGMVVFGSIRLPALSPQTATSSRRGADRTDGAGESPIGKQKVASGHTRLIYHLAWSSDGRHLLSSSQDETLRRWRLDIQRDSASVSELEFALSEEKQVAFPSVKTLAWSPDGTAAAVTGFQESAVQVLPVNGSTIPNWEYRLGASKILSLAWAQQFPMIALGADSYQVVVIDARNGSELRRFFADAEISCLAFSPDGRMLAAGTQNSSARAVYVWDLRSEKLVQVLRGHEGGITCLCWWPGEDILVSGSVDASVWVWDVGTGKKLRTLRNHTAPLTSLTVSHDGTMLASAAQDATVCLWSRQNDWRLVYLTQYVGMTYAPCDIVFHPHRPLLAAVSNQHDITVTSFNFDAMQRYEAVEMVYYSAAKVVVVGDGGAGKTSLCHALADDIEPMEVTESAETLSIFRMSRTTRQNDTPVRREIYLWDMDGQSEYQIVNQLYLNNVSVALLVFARNHSTDPFHGLRQWNDALETIRQHETDSRARRPGSGAQKLLVQTRLDQQLAGVSQSEIDQFVARTDCYGFYETSAKDNRGIQELRAAMERQIDWDAAGLEVTTAVYDKIRRFIEWVQKNEDIQIASSQQLFVRYLEYAPPEVSTNTTLLRAQFETCLNYLAVRHLVRRFDFRRLVLLRTELFNTYAVAIIRAAGHGENQAFGVIAEQTILSHKVDIPAEQRVRKPKEEEWMLMATIQDLLRFEVAFLEEGTLIFPSQLASGWDGDFEHEGEEQLIFSFEGAITHIYAKLVIRLSHIEQFKRLKLARRKAQFEASDGGICGLKLAEDNQSGQLSVYFSRDLSTLNRYTFDLFIFDLLKRETPKESLKRKRVYYCTNPACGGETRIRFDDRFIEARLAMGKNDIICPVCGEYTSIAEPPISQEMQDALKLRQAQLRRYTDQSRDLQLAESLYRNKQATGNYDIYLEGWGVGAPNVSRLTDLLRLRGILTLQGELDVSAVAERVLSVVFLVGQSRLSAPELQQLEMRLQQYLDCAMPVIIALYRINDTPELLLKLLQMASRTIYFFDDLDDQRNLSELVGYITGTDPR
jgi:WD40 repeat protein/signal recognition particle receptor subunit beta